MAVGKKIIPLLGALCALACSIGLAHAQEKGGAASSGAQVHVAVTEAALRTDSELPPLQKEDVKVKQGKNFLDVTHLIPAQGENAALQLMILIDDTLDTMSVGNNLQDIKDFVSAQPATTVVAVGYMSNTGVQLAQNFTPDKDLAIKAIRLPRGTLSSADSPYLSLISLVKGWTPQKVRREIIMVSDGLDRLRGERPEPTRLGPNYAGAMGAGPAYTRGGSTAMTYHSMPTMTPDVDSASEVSQRYNVIVFPIYSPGVGRAGRSSWDLQIGLSGLTKIADETGGECFSLSTSNAVSFKPYMERLQKYLNSQYYVVFNAVQEKKDRLTRINIQGVGGKDFELFAPDNVWVPGIGKTAQPEAVQQQSAKK